MDFLGNIKNSNNIDQTADILLSYELLLIEKLHFQLVIHTAYRPFEGLIIDLKVLEYFKREIKKKHFISNLDSLFTGECQRCRSITFNWL